MVANIVAQLVFAPRRLSCRCERSELGMQRGRPQSYHVRSRRFNYRGVTASPSLYSLAETSPPTAHSIPLNTLFHAVITPKNKHASNSCFEHNHPDSGKGARCTRCVCASTSYQVCLRRFLALLWKELHQDINFWHLLTAINIQLLFSDRLIELNRKW